MKNIKRVVVGSNVTSLEDRLFKDMTGLEEVDFAKCKVDVPIPRECFSGCISLQQCICPTGSKKCDDYTFFNCEQVKTIQLPDTVESIGLSSFCNCKDLTDVNVPNAVTSLADGSFQNCTAVNNLKLANVMTIGDNAFRDCKRLQSIDRFNGSDSAVSVAFNTVGEYAFANTGLTTAKLTLRGSTDQTWWGEYCFASCDNLETVEFLSSCYLGSHMFDGCKKLKNVSVDTGGISYVGKYVFKDCTSLTSVSFPKEQFSFLEGFFEGCTSLKEVKFNDYDKGSQFCYVQKNAFNGCEQLTSIEFPESLNSISKLEDAALSGCSNLKTIIFHGIDKDSIGTEGNVTAVQLITTGFLRANCSLTVITKDGSPLNYTYKPSEVRPYDPPYEYAANKTQFSDFKTPDELCKRYSTMESAHWDGANPWYYDIKGVVEYATKQSIPALCFYSYETCTPCQSFKTNIYEAADFQDWVKKQKFLVCRIEADKPKAYDQELAYCEDVLSRDALNYCKDGATTPISYNGFGDEVARGWFSDTVKDGKVVSKNLTPPVMVFYYKDAASGKLVANHAYSLHPLNDYINAEDIGIDGVKQLIKSLCLYHFDNNSLDNPKFVVDAGRGFDKDEYILKNPYQSETEDDVIILDRWKNLDGKVKTADSVKAEMKKVLEEIQPVVQSCNYPEYIGGCLFDKFDWISLTFKGNDYFTLTDGNDAYADNQVLAKVKMQIGEKRYKLVLDPSVFKPNIATPCTSSSTLFKYNFQEVN